MSCAEKVGGFGKCSVSETVECRQRMAVQNKGGKEVEHNSGIYLLVNWFSSEL